MTYAGLLLEVKHIQGRDRSETSGITVLNKEFNGLFLSATILLFRKIQI